MGSHTLLLGLHLRSSGGVLSTLILADRVLSRGIGDLVASFLIGLRRLLGQGGSRLPSCPRMLAFEVLQTPRDESRKYSLGLWEAEF